LDSRFVPLPSFDRRSRRVAAPLLLAAAGVVVLARCGDSGSSSGSSGSSAAPPPPAASSAPAAGAGTAVTADETEFKIALSQNSFAPGTYTFNAKNSGKFPHALTIDGPGVSNQATPTLKAGESGSVTVNLVNGTYTVYCPVDGHRDKGMQMTINVGGGGATTSSSTSSGGSSGSGAGGY